MRNVICLLALAACGSSHGNKNTDAPGQGGSDSGSGMHHDSGSGSADAQPAPAMITITGTATAPGLGGDTPVAGATVAAYKASAPTTVVTMATTDGSGNFTLTVTTGGVALDGFLKATDSGYLDTYLWPPAPLAADFSGAAVEMLTASNESLATGTLCGVSGGQLSTDALIGLKVEDGSGNGVGSATVTASPAAAKYCYDGSNGLPSRTATSTGSDGVALLINVPAGSVALSASATGSTFASHTLSAVAGAFTETLIVP